LNIQRILTEAVFFFNQPVSEHPISPTSSTLQNDAREKTQKSDSNKLKPRLSVSYLINLATQA